MSDSYHIPALLHDAIDLLDIKPDGIYVDVTYGGGGHSREILSHLGPEGHLYSLDQDKDALENGIKDKRLTLIHGNFRFLKNYLKFYDIDKVDGILADLGVSFHHFDTPERGFSFRNEGPLDMRMNPAASMTVSRFLKETTPDELQNVLSLYGELSNARKLAQAIIKRRDTGELKTTTDLLETVNPLINPRQEKKELAQIFQALRIKVNDELKVLETLLEQTPEILASGGRVAIISYHSLEDRLIKNFFKSGSISETDNRDFFGRNLSPFKLITNKPITPSEEEIERNPRSRSAKLRVAEKI